MRRPDCSEEFTFIGVDPTFIINELISDFQAQDVILDFEGSMISGVEKFYQSFGAQPESYFYYKKRII